MKKAARWGLVAVFGGLFVLGCVSAWGMERLSDATMAGIRGANIYPCGDAFFPCPSLADQECHNGYQCRSTGVSGVMRGKIGGTDLIGAERCGKAYDGVNCSHDMGQRCGYLLPVAPCTE